MTSFVRQMSVLQVEAPGFAASREFAVKVMVTDSAARDDVRAYADAEQAARAAVKDWIAERAEMNGRYTMISISGRWEEDVTLRCREFICLGSWAPVSDQAMTEFFAWQKQEMNERKQVVGMGV